MGLFFIFILASALSLLIKSTAGVISPILLSLPPERQGVYALMGIFLPVIALVLFLARPPQ
jgi:hypothetical protein